MTRIERILLIIGFSMIIFSSASYAAGVKITAIDFHGTKKPNELEIQGSAPIQAEKQVNSEDHQVVITIPGATLAKGIQRAIDTSSFNSPVTLISPYQLAGQNPGVRIVVQLRKDAPVELTQAGKSLKLTVGEGLAAAESGSAPEANTEASAEAPKASKSGKKESSEDIDVAESSDKTTTSAAAPEPHDEMQRFLTNTKTQHFTGKPITLQVRDADVGDIFSLISDASGFNIILGEDVKGKLTLSLVDVPWDQALDVVLKTLQLGADRNGNVLRVMTLKSLATEKELEAEAQRATEAITPRITRVFPINYADLTALKTHLVTLLGGKGQGASDIAAASAANPTTAQPATATPAATAAGGRSASASSGEKLSVVADERTNSLVVQTFPDNMERVRKLIEILDTQTPEVLIEGKVIEATESFSRNIGGSLGIADIANGAYSVAFSGANAIDPLLGGSTSVITDTNVGTASQNGGQFGWSLVKSSPRITALLNIGQTENKLKIVSSPKTVVLNKQDATVVQSTPVIVPSFGIGPNGGIVTTSQVQQANLSLDVTPTVTSEGSVLMKLTLERDVPFQASGATQANAVANRSIKTDVLVESGNTLVMGGFYTTSDQEGSTGFPILKDIPIIGWLFGNNSHLTDRSELFFFITPQILNAKKSGPTGSPAPEQAAPQGNTEGETG